MKVQYGDLSDLFQATFESRSCIRMGGSLNCGGLDIGDDSATDIRFTFRMI